MAIFSDKVVTAKFLDYPNNMIIEILYEETGKLVPYQMEVDFTSDDFNDLLKEITLEEIEKNSEEEVNLAAKVFNDAVIQKVNELWELEAEKIKKAYEEIDRYQDDRTKKAYEEVDNYKDTMKSDLASKYQSEFLSNRTLGIEDMSPKDIFNYLTKRNEDNDFVFNFKVGILEDPLIGKSKDKALKLSIRKSKTLFELLKFYGEAKGAS